MSNETSQNGDRSGIQVISRAAGILRALEGIPAGLSLGEIAKTVSLPRSTVQRIVGALVDEGLLMAATPNAKVRLGPAILQLAASFDFDLVKTLRPFLLELSRDVQETVDLSIRKGNSMVFIDQVQGKRRLIAISGIGEQFPLHCTANGKAVLATLTDDQAKLAIDRSIREYDDRPPADLPRLLEELEAARMEMITYDREENSQGIGAVGTALRDPTGVLFAIAIPVPIQRFRKNEKELVEKLLFHRNRIQTKLGLPT